MTDAQTQAPFETIDEEKCRALVPHLEFIGRRWIGATLLAGARGARRFSEYRVLVEGISDRLLSLRLKELEAAGLMTRSVEATTPVSIRYEPTARGRELITATHPLAAWAVRDAERPRLHAVSD